LGKPSPTGLEPSQQLSAVGEARVSCSELFLKKLDIYSIYLVYSAKWKNTATQAPYSSHYQPAQHRYIIRPLPSPNPNPPTPSRHRRHQPPVVLPAAPPLPPAARPVLPPASRCPTAISPVQRRLRCSPPPPSAHCPSSPPLRAASRPSREEWRRGEMWWQS
jgi:hypothetical protein